MTTSQILGIAGLAVGAVLLGFGYHLTDNTMWYVVVGIAALATGGFLAVFGKRA